MLNIPLQEKSDILINSCMFINNSGNIGSVIFISGNFNVSIENSFFISNKAFNTSSNSGMATCLFFKPLTQNMSSLSIKSSSFVNNSAEFNMKQSA